MNSQPEPAPPLVTVIMPVYNHAEYVVESLGSLLEEGYPNLELLVLDDGSKDDSLTRVQEWVGAHGHQFTRTKVWTQPNAGVCKTLNRLVTEAAGAFVSMVASDDRLLPGGIQARVSALRAHPEWLLVFGDAQTINGTGQILHTSTLKAHRADLKALADPRRMPFELLLRWSLPGPVFLARRGAWDTVIGVGPYDESLFLEDRDFYLRLLAKRSVGFLPQAVAQYRVHGSNACKDPSHRPRLRETLARSAELNIHRFKGAAGAILAAQAKERRAALGRRPLARLWAKIVLALFRGCHRIHLLVAT